MIISGFVIFTNQQVEELIVQEELATSIALEVGELGYLSNDYILYREPLKIERWSAKYDSISQKIAQLSSDHPEQQVIATALAQNLNNTRSVFNDISASPVGPVGVATGYIQLSWSRIEVQNQGMIFDAGRLARLIHNQTEEMRQTRTLLIFSLVVAFVAFLLTSYYFGSRKILKSIDQLSRGAAIIGSGDFSYHIDDSSDNEIGDLAHSFNQMTTDLRRVTARKADLEAEVAERVRAETALAQNNEALSAAREKLQNNLDELTRAQEKLQSSEERYRNLFTTMTEGLAIHEIICDDDGNPVDYRFLEINPAFERLTGLTRNTIIGARITGVLPGTDLSLIRRYGKVALTRNPDHFEHYSAELDRYFSIVAYSPAPRQFAVIFSDITERRFNEDILHLSAEVFRIAAACDELSGMLDKYARFLQDYTGCTAIGICLLDESGSMFCQGTTGFSEPFPAEEGPLSLAADTCMYANVIKGTTDPSLPYYTDGGSFYTNAMTTLLPAVSGADGEVPGNTCNRSGYESTALIPIRKGTAIFGLVYLADRREGMVPERVVKILENVGFSLSLSIQQVTAEISLRKTSQYLENLITYANAPIIVWDREFRITRFNRAFEVLTGMTTGEVIGLHLSSIFPEKFRDASMQIVLNTMWGERLDVVELPVLRKDGAVRVVLWNSATLYEPDGKTLISTIAQGQDITDRKIAEAGLTEKNRELLDANQELAAIQEELRATNEDLVNHSNLLAARNEELTALNEELVATQEELHRRVEDLDRSEKDLRQNETELKEALAEKEILLSEIHHRVKNNLTAFISLLSLDGSMEETPSGKALKKDLQNRARSMALIHDTLYRTGKFSVVDMDVYLTTLVGQIAGSYAERADIQTVVRANGITLDLARATVSGLIINELITNSFKYAFPPDFNCMAERGESCMIRISLTADNGMYVLTVADNGQGLPAGLDIKTTKSLGLKLVNFLARHQLRAETGIRTGNGTEFTFRMPDKMEYT